MRRRQDALYRFVTVTRASCASSGPTSAANDGPRIGPHLHYMSREQKQKTELLVLGISPKVNPYVKISAQTQTQTQTGTNFCARLNFRANSESQSISCTAQTLFSVRPQKFESVQSEPTQGQ